MSSRHLTTVRRSTLRGLDLERKCFDLKRRGKDATVIADELSLPVRRVHAALTRHMARHAYVFDNEVETEKRIALDRYNEMTEALYGRATGDETRMVSLSDGREVPVRDVDYEAIKLLKMIEERKAAILGYDAPKKTRADVDITTHKAEIDLTNLSSTELAQMQDMLERAQEAESNKTAIPATATRLLEPPE